MHSCYCTISKHIRLYLSLCSFKSVSQTMFPVSQPGLSLSWISGTVTIYSSLLTGLSTIILREFKSRHSEFHISIQYRVLRRVMQMLPVCNVSARLVPQSSVHLIHVNAISCSCKHSYTHAMLSICPQGSYPCSDTTNVTP